MSEMLCVENGGVQYVPQILETKQIIYLDFDGALSRYDGEYLTVDRVEVTDSQLSPERVAAIVTALNAQFAGMNIEFVSERPDSAEYSTIFVGKTSAFDSYGNYAGLAETIDHDNENKSDNAFVMLDAASSDAEIVSVISHEAAHLTGLLDHGGSGLDAYAVTSTFYSSYPNSMFIGYGDDITLIGGGTYATTIAYGGRLTLLNSAYADDLHIRAGGVLAVSSGGRVTSVTVSSGGSMYVNEYAAYLTAVNILDGAVVNLSGSVPLGKIHVSSGGALHLSSGIQYSSGLQIYSSGKAIVRSGAVVSNTELLESKARLLISSGGSAVETCMFKGTTIEVYQGGELSSNHRMGVVSAFGTCQISVRGGRMVNTTLCGTTADIFSGGLASQVNIIGFGLIQVRSGGYVNNVTIEKNGKMTFADYASGGKVTVQSGGLLDIYTTGTLLSSVTIEKNGLLQGFTFASAITMTSIGGAEIKPYSNVSIKKSLMTVSSGMVAGVGAATGSAMIHISSGGKVGTLDMINGAKCHIRSGGVVSSGHMQFSSTTVYVSSGGQLLAGAVTDSATLHISSGGSARNVKTLRYGEVIVSSGASAINMDFSDAGRLLVSSGGSVLRPLLQQSNSYADIQGTCLSATVTTGASLVVVSRGVASKTTFLANGSGGVYDGAFIDTELNDACLYVNRGGVASATTLGYHGVLVVSSSAMVQDTTIDYGGLLALSNGGMASGTEVNSSGCMIVSSGATARHTTVHSGGSMTIDYRAEIGGRMVFESGAVISASRGAVIDFTVAEQTAGAAALLNDWSSITDAGAYYTITVKADQAFGTYALAGGAANFNKTITVKTADAKLGTITVGETLTVGNTGYTLNTVDDLLSLTIADLTPPPVVENATTAEIILTISDANHPSFGATGGWKVQTDQTIVWQDLSPLSGDYQVLGQGYTVAGKAMTDIYIYSPSAKYIGVYTTDDTGAITGFDGVFSTENALMQVGLGDFNADGVSDLLLRTADGYLGFYANGAFTAVQGLGTEWQVNALGDVNGDGTTDMIISHTPGGYVGAYLIGKDGSITWGDLGSTEGGIEIVGTGDFNADGTDDVLVKSGSYYGAWLCGNGSVTGFFGIGNFDATVQDIADYNADGTDDILFRTADGIIGAALITGPDSTTWTQYGALGSEWSTKGVGIL